MISVHNSDVNGTSVDDFKHRSGAFMAWLQRLPGIEISQSIRLERAETHGPRKRVVATAVIPEDTDILTIPRNHVLTVATSSLRTSLPTSALADFDDLASVDPWTALILAIMHEHALGSASAWKPYLDMLPQSADEFDTLMFWTKDELQELQASAVRDKVGKEEADEGFRENILPFVRRFPDVFIPRNEQEEVGAVPDEAVLALAHRFGSTIMAYAFDLEPENVVESTNINADNDVNDNSAVTAVPAPMLDEEGYALLPDDDALPKCLVPLASLLTSDAQNSPLVNTRLCYGSTNLVVKTLRSIAPGEELRTDHGAVPRSDTLRRSGYVTDASKEFDVVEVSREVLVAAAMRYRKLEKGELEKRLEYLDEKELLDDGYDIPCSSPCFPEELLILLKTLLAPKGSSYKSGALASLPLPQANALNVDVSRVLMDAVQTRLQQYPTSLAQDTALLKQLNNTEPQGPDQDQPLDTDTSMSGTGTGTGTGTDLRASTSNARNAEPEEAYNKSRTTRRRKTMAIEVRLGEKQILAAAQNEAAAMVRRFSVVPELQNGAGSGGVVSEDGRVGKKRRVG